MFERLKSFFGKNKKNTLPYEQVYEHNTTEQIKKQLDQDMRNFELGMKDVISKDRIVGESEFYYIFQNSLTNKLYVSLKDRDDVDMDNHPLECMEGRFYHTRTEINRFFNKVDDVISTSIGPVFMITGEDNVNHYREILDNAFNSQGITQHTNVESVDMIDEMTVRLVVRSLVNNSLVEVFLPPNRWNYIKRLVH